MPILRDIPFSLTVEVLLEAQRGHQAKEQPAAAVAVAERALLLGRAHFAPAAVYDEFKVHMVAAGGGEWRERPIPNRSCEG